MASDAITSWQIEWEKVEAETDFLFLGFKIKVDGNCGHKIRRQLLLGRKVMTNLDSMFNSKDHFADKFHIVKAMIFPVVMYECESWTVKTAELPRIYAF